MLTHLFVYGTLLRRSRHPMARVLAEQADYVGPARVPGRLYDLGRYPGLLEPASPDDWVHGDLYQLRDGSSTLAEMDAYEVAETPAPAYFERQAGEAHLADGTTVPTWLYRYHGTVSEAQRLACGQYQ